MAVFNVQEAQELLEDLIERALAGEEIIVSSDDGFLVRFEPRQQGCLNEQSESTR